MLNLNDLRIFANVVEHRSFSAAARALKAPKSTLSKRVAALEAALGARLLHRNARHVTPTPLGNDVLTHARAMTLEAEAAEMAAARLRTEPAGIVRVTCGTITAQYHLATVWPALVGSYPRLEPVVHATDRVVDIVAEGYDIAIRDHLAPLPDSDLVAIRLGVEPDYLVASPDFVRRNGLPESPVELSRQPCIGGSPTGRRERWSLKNGNATRAIEPKVGFCSDDPVAVLNMALAGHGLARLPRIVCQVGLAGGQLVRVLPDWVVEGPTTTLLYPGRRGQLPAVRATIDFVARELGRRLRDTGEDC